MAKHSGALNKVTRLAIAATLAPKLRSGNGRSRKVKTYDQTATPPDVRTDEISVQREMSLAEAQLGMLRHLEVEIAVQPECRPEKVICRNCGKVVLVEKNGPVPDTCQDGCSRHCDTEGCANEIALSRARERAKSGKPAHCRSCSAAAASLRISVDERRSHYQKTLGALSTEQRRTNGFRSAMRVSKEERERNASKAGLVSWAKLDEVHRLAKLRSLQKGSHTASANEKRAESLRSAWASKRTMSMVQAEALNRGRARRWEEWEARMQPVKVEAKRLAEAGYSLRVISKMLGVSRTVLARWQQEEAQ